MSAVEQHDLRLHRQRLGNCATLLLPAGKMVWILVPLIRNPDLLEQFLSAVTHPHAALSGWIGA